MASSVPPPFLKVEWYQETGATELLLVNYNDKYKRKLWRGCWALVAKDSKAGKKLQEAKRGIDCWEEGVRALISSSEGN